MHSPEVALARDFVRRGAAVVPVTLAAMIALPAWIWLMLGRDGALSAISREGVGLHFTLTLFMGFGAAVAIIQALGQLSRFFVRPISATRLVTIQMVLAMGTIAVMYLIAGSLLNLGGMHWPLLGPALFLATAIACGLAAIWCFEGSIFNQLMACTLVCVPLVAWFSRCYGAVVFGDWQAMWSSPSALEVLTMAGASLVAYGVAIRGVARIRHGQVWNFAALSAWFDRQRSRQTPPTAYASPWAAQLDFESRKLRYAPAVLALCLALFVLLRLVGLITTSTMLELVIAFPLVGLVFLLPLVFGVLLGNRSVNKHSALLSPFLGTLPVTDQFLAAAMLRNCAQTLAANWGTLLLCHAVIFGAMWLAGAPIHYFPDWDTVRQRLFEIVLWLLFPAISWIVLTSMATTIATGRAWVCIVVVSWILFWTMLVFVVGQSLDAPQAEPLIQAWFGAGAVQFLAITVSLYFLAYRRRLVSTRTIFIALVVWLAMGVVVLSVITRHHWFDLATWHTIAFLSLAVMPFAGLPLAVRWNRHR
jgi:hypothetical protein